MPYAAIGPIAIHFPARRESNDQLQALFPRWDMPRIEEKTGIAVRYIAEKGECSSDLGVSACEALFEQHNLDRRSIDFLLLCTQTPDYPLPTTACLMQHRLGLRTDTGALDFNLGCSGFVYGLSLADGLIRTGAVQRVLLVTAETYSKFIHPEDRSLRTIFSDAAAATLIEACEKPTLQSFVFGTDGSGADTLMVNRGGARPPEDAIQPRNRWRWPSSLYMDGPSLIEQTVRDVPLLAERVLKGAGVGRAEIDYYLMHQATKKMLEELRSAMQIDDARMPIELLECGNTVSSTLPILIGQMRKERRLRLGMKSLLIGFGVGYSSAGCLWTENWQDNSNR